MSSVSVIGEPIYRVEMNAKEYRLMKALVGQSSLSSVQRALGQTPDDTSYNDVLNALYAGLEDVSA